MSTTVEELGSQGTERNSYENPRVRNSGVWSSNRSGIVTFADEADQNDIGGIISGVEEPSSEEEELLSEAEWAALGFKQGVVYEELNSDAEVELNSDPDLEGLDSDSDLASANSEAETVILEEDGEPMLPLYNENDANAETAIFGDLEMMLPEEDLTEEQQPIEIEERKLRAEEQKPQVEEQVLHARKQNLQTEGTQSSIFMQEDGPFFIDNQDGSTSQSMISGTKKSNKRKKIETSDGNDGNQDSMEIRHSKKLKIRQKKEKREESNSKNSDWEETLKAERRIAAARKEGEMQSKRERIIKPGSDISHQSRPFQSPLKLSRGFQSNHLPSLQDLARSSSTVAQNKGKEKQKQKVT